MSRNYVTTKQVITQWQFWPAMLGCGRSQRILKNKRIPAGLRGSVKVQMRPEFFKLLKAPSPMMT